MEKDAILARVRELDTELRGAGTNKAMIDAVIKGMDNLINEATVTKTDNAPKPAAAPSPKPADAPKPASK